MSRPQVQVRVWCSAYPKCEYHGYRFEKNADKPCPRCDGRVIESRTEPKWWDPSSQRRFPR